MTTATMLPYMFKRYGEHNIVRLADPAILDLSQPFFGQGLPDKGTGQGIMGFEEWLAQQPELDADYSDFSGIFHVSRCGSTLLSRNIRETEQAIVLSEPPFFRVLRHRMWDTVDEDVAYRACLAMLDPWRKWARRAGRRLVVKFSSQMHMHLPRLIEKLVGARFLFLHREPLAVLESLDRKPPMYLKREAAQKRIALIEPLQSIKTDPKLLAAVNRYCTGLDVFGKLPCERVKSVAYPDLVDRYGEILRHFGLDPDTAPAWSAELDAKAKLENGEDPRPYTPVSEERLDQFEKANPELLQVARASYETFLKSSASGVA